MAHAVRLENRIQPYPWGSKTAIPRLLGRPETGEPQAELWIGTHPRAPSRVRIDGSPTLREWLEAAPDARLGSAVKARYGGLPFLLKYLAADAPLSIQCHPNAAQAQAGFQREEAAGVPRDAPTRTYRDPNPKPELIVARRRFEALCGFRAPEDIRVRLRALDLPELATHLPQLEAEDPRAGLEAFYRGLMTLPEPEQARLSRAAVRAAEGHAGDPALEWVVKLGARYPGDVGVLSPLLLQYILLEPGEALFLGAGVLHAYLRGEGVEIMASSDNVVRGGLTRKHVDVPELLELLEYRFDPQIVLRPEPAGPGLAVYRTPAEHFELYQVTPGPEGAPLPPRPGPAALFALAGALELDEGDARTRLSSGDAVFLPADRGEVTVRGDGEAVWATVPNA